MAILPRSPRSNTTTTTTTQGVNENLTVAASNKVPMIHHLRKPTSPMGGARVAPAPEEAIEVSQDYLTEPASLRSDAWAEPPADTFLVRGATYQKDKVKTLSESAAFRLLTVDLVNTETPIYGGLCAHPNERIQLALKREEQTGVRELPPFVFAVNLCIPGDKIYHQVSYYAIDDMEEVENPTTPFGRLMNKFIFGESDDFRNNTFKLIPKIVQGNIVVRKAVGTKPSILGKKIKQHYIRGERFFEIVVDIASDKVAQRIVKLALGYAKTLVVDMMFVLEGTDEATLPERIFGGLRVKNIDFKTKDGKRSVHP